MKSAMSKYLISPNLVRDAILGINFLKENNVVINLTEGHFMARRDFSDCENKFVYDLLPKNGEELVSHQIQKCNLTCLTDKDNRTKKMK